MFLCLHSNAYTHKGQSVQPYDNLYVHTLYIYNPEEWSIFGIGSILVYSCRCVGYILIIVTFSV